MAKSYASLKKALEELRERQKRRKIIEKNGSNIKIESFQLTDLLTILSKELSPSEKRRDRRRIPTALENCNTALDSFSLDNQYERPLLWAAIAYLMDAFQRTSDIYNNFQDYLIRAGEEFKKTIDPERKYKSPSMIKNMAGMQICFVGSLTNITEQALSTFLL